VQETSNEGREKKVGSKLLGFGFKMLLNTEI